MVIYPQNVQSLFGQCPNGCGVNFTGASLHLIVLILFVICVVVAATFEAEVRETSLKSTLSLLPMIKENKEMWFFSHIAGGLVEKKIRLHRDAKSGRYGSYICAILSKAVLIFSYPQTAQ